MFLRLFSNVKQDLLYFYPIIFFLWFNTFNMYSWYSGSINAVYNQQVILRAMLAFETYNLFVDGYYNSNNKIMIYHHILAIVNPAISLLYYEPDTQYITALVQLVTINLSSNMFLCLQYYWKNNYSLKLIFSATFFYFRIHLMYSYFLLACKGQYISTEYYWQSMVITSSIIQLYILNWYWATLIGKKIYTSIFIRKALKEE
jgi:hypothetical protein